MLRCIRRRCAGESSAGERCLTLEIGERDRESSMPFDCTRQRTTNGRRSAALMIGSVC